MQILSLKCMYSSSFKICQGFLSMFNNYREFYKTYDSFKETFQIIDLATNMISNHSGQLGQEDWEFDGKGSGIEATNQGFRTSYEWCTLRYNKPIQ